MIKIRVPATSANMGPGFDCLGIALDMYNTFTVEEIEKGLEISGCEEAFQNENNLFYQSMQKCFDKVGYHPKGLRIGIEGDIPISRGLGSSASCILGGVMAANELAGGLLNKQEILELATELEGHPDNIAPALFGGMVVSILESGKVYYDKVQLAPGLKFCAMIPDFTLSTKESRAVLPDEIPRKDGVFNVARVSLMITALTNGSFDLIQYSCEDRLHQTYRGKLISDYDVILKKAQSLGCLGVYLSGAGPTIMGILREEDKDFPKEMEGFLGDLENKWVVKELGVDMKGTFIERK